MVSANLLKYQIPYMMGGGGGGGEFPGSENQSCIEWYETCSFWNFEIQ